MYFHTRLLGYILFATLASSATAAAGPPEMKQLIERIANGEADEAAEATDQLVELISRQLADAFGAIEQRPQEQQDRLQAALARVTAVMRLRLYRAGLLPDEQQLLDKFIRPRAELAEALFADSARQRLQALHQIPLEPDTGAGLLISAKVNDWDADICAAALETAANLGDQVVARGLREYVTTITAAVRADRFGPAQQDYELVLADFTRQAIVILGATRDRESVTTIIEAVQVFSRSHHRRFFRIGSALGALGQIGDEQAVPLLLEYLSDRETHEMRSVAPGTLLHQTVGDVALQALGNIYGITPAELGFFIGPAPEQIAGFVDKNNRAAALRAFGTWHQQNATLPRDQRAPLTTQPADED
ncbi:MAG: HEAT repeat domain-containing protein [Planctomycetota bacterium]